MFKSIKICNNIGCLIMIFAVACLGCQTAAPTVAPPKPKPSPSQSAAAAAATAETAADKAFDELGSSGKTGAKPTPQPHTAQAPAVGHGNQDRSANPDVPGPEVISGQQQDWVNGTSRKYPATRFLTAVGTGPDRAQAEDNARAEMAKVFVSHVNASTKVEQEYLQVVSKGKDSQTSRVNVRDMVAVSTRKVLSGVRIAEVYQQQQPQSLIYALAVLDRQQTLTTLKQKLQATDQEINNLMAQASAQKKELEKIKLLTAAVEKHLLRQTHEAELTVVDPSGKGMPAPIGFQEIKRQLNDILNKNFRIHVAVSGDRAAEVQKALSEGLTREGFVLTGNPRQAKVAVKGKVQIKPLNRPDEKWKYVRWQTAFDLVDLSNQTVFGTLSNNGREGHLNLEQAANRAIMKIQKELLPNVSKDVHAYIFGQ